MGFFVDLERGRSGADLTQKGKERMASVLFIFAAQTLMGRL